MLKRWTARLMLICLLLCCSMSAQAESGLSKQQLYTSTMEQVRLYLVGEVEQVLVTQDGEEINLLDRLAEIFEALGRYQNSAAFSLYVSVLRDVELDEYGEVYVRISQLRRNPAFCDFLVENEFCSLDELENYARARQAEKAGDVEAAIGYYEQSINMLDSMTRLIDMEDQQLESKYEKAKSYAAQDTPEGYRQAYELYQELAGLSYRDSHSRMQEAKKKAGDAPVPPAGKTGPTTALQGKHAPERPTAAPTDQPHAGFVLTANAGDEYIRLNWDGQGANVRCTIYRSSRGESWKKLTTTRNNYYFDYDVNHNTTYRYYVAVEGSQPLNSNEVAVTMGSTAAKAEATRKPTATPTQKPAAAGTPTVKPTATPTVKPTATPTADATVEPIWGEWSEWQLTPVTPNSRRQVEIINEHGVRFVTLYTYTRYCYTDLNGKECYYPSEYRGSDYASGGEWQSKTLKTQLAFIGRVDGYKCYTGYWFNEQTEQSNEWFDEDYYRYRDRLN